MKRASLLAVFVALLLPWASTGRTDGGTETPSYDRKVNLAYTVNNLGYTDTCG